MKGPGKDKGKTKKGTRAPAPKPPTEDPTSDKGAQRRIALLRNKLTQAMEDPLMRDQIVRAIRSMMIKDS